MTFFIQASCPKISDNISFEADTLSDAVENSFPLLTESAIIFWNNVPIFLSYKYDVCLMIDDILDILEALRTKEFGSKDVHWVSNTFPHIWHFKWISGQLRISAEWGDINDITEHSLRDSGSFNIPIQSFGFEWKRVLYNIIVALKKAGFEESKIVGMSRLIQEFNLIGNEGYLYHS
ncbi:hypothetical protein AB4Z21_23275 [Paenibacillus sp. MCAF20]